MRRAWNVLHGPKDGFRPKAIATVVFRTGMEEHYWPPAAARKLGEALIREADRAEAREDLLNQQLRRERKAKKGGR